MDLQLLALETSSSLCGVALLSLEQGRLNMRSAAHDATGEHAERLLPMVDQLLEQAGLTRNRLTAVAFGQGPGGFTGLRVACGVAQGIAFALDLPVIPVGSLLAVAALDQSLDQAVAVPAAPAPAIRVVVQDARMGEVYLAAYQPIVADALQTEQWRVMQAPILLDADDVGNWLCQSRIHWIDASGRRPPVKLVGDALAAYPQLLALGAAESGATGPGDISLGGPLRPTAPIIAQLAFADWQRGIWLSAELAAPLYVRDKVAYTTHERAQGLGGNPRAGEGAVSILPMTAEDLARVVDIERTVQSHPWTHGNFSDALATGYGAWVARRGDKTVGFCVIMFAPDVAHLLLIAVAPGEQRKGVGALLLSHCERESAARDLPGLILEVRPSNHKAIAFYRHHGYAQLSVRKDYYPLHRDQREDAWVMEKKLTVSEAPHG